jgi:hypothetical protein
VECLVGQSIEVKSMSGHVPALVVVVSVPDSAILSCIVTFRPRRNFKTMAMGSV